MRRKLKTKPGERRRVLKTSADGKTEVYPSVTAAARCNYMCAQSMTYRCNGSKKSPDPDGSTYRYMDDTEEE